MQANSTYPRYSAFQPAISIFPPPYTPEERQQQQQNQPAIVPLDTVAMPESMHDRMRGEYKLPSFNIPKNVACDDTNKIINDMLSNCNNSDDYFNYVVNPESYNSQPHATHTKRQVDFYDTRNSRIQPLAMRPQMPTITKGLAINRIENGGHRPYEKNYFERSRTLNRH